MTAQADHMEKISRWHTLLRRQCAQDAAAAMTDAVHLALYRMPLQLMAAADENGNIRFALPQFVFLLCGTLSRLTLQMDSVLRTDCAVLRYGIQTADGTPLTPMHTISLGDTEPSQPLTLTISAPRSPVSGLLVLEYAVHQNAGSTRGSMPCVVTALHE